MAPTFQTRFAAVIVAVWIAHGFLRNIAARSVQRHIESDAALGAHAFDAIGPAGVVAVRQVVAAAVPHGQARMLPAIAARRSPP